MYNNIILCYLLEWSKNLVSSEFAAAAAVSPGNRHGPPPLVLYTTTISLHCSKGRVCAYTNLFQADAYILYKYSLMYVEYVCRVDFRLW